MKKPEELERLLHISFKNKDLLNQALTHSSYVHEHPELSENPKYINFYSNERLEFLGDSLLNMIVCHYLFFTLPHLEEGELAKLKAYIISQETLYRWAQTIDLGEYLFVGRGEEVSGGRKKASILSDALEAIIGAMFLDDNNIKAITEVVMKFLEEDNVIAKIKPSTMDYKTCLQERTQTLYRRLPTYKNYKDFGPDHAKMFEVDVYLDEQLLGHGVGHSKREADQEAAKQAMEKLK